MLLSKRNSQIALLLVSALSWNACNGDSDVQSVQSPDDGGGAPGDQTSPVAEASAGTGGQVTEAAVPEGAPEAAAPDGSDRDAPPESALDAAPDGSAGDASDDAASDASEGSDTVIVGFDSPDDLDRFRFFTPDPHAVAGNWVWVPPPNAHLAQTVNVTSGTGPVATGTNAIYKDGWFRDARVSVRIWTTDVTGGAGIFARYFDDTHYYRLAISTTGLSIHKHDGDSFQLLGCTSSAAGGGCIYNPAFFYDFVAAAQTFTFEFIGSVLRAYDQHGVLLLEVTDSAFAEGQVGLYCRAMYDANFDNFVIEPLDAAPGEL